MPKEIYPPLALRWVDKLVGGTGGGAGAGAGRIKRRFYRYMKNEVHFGENKGGISAYTKK